RCPERRQEAARVSWRRRYLSSKRLLCSGQVEHRISTPGPDRDGLPLRLTSTPCGRTTVLEAVSRNAKSGLRLPLSTAGFLQLSLLLQFLRRRVVQKLTFSQRLTCPSRSPWNALASPSATISPRLST